MFFSKELNTIIEANNFEEIIKNIRYVFVGDNPGKEEKSKCDDFQGHAGVNLNNF